jgi:hypothetical protein
MPLRELPWKSIDQLIKTNLSTEEWEKAVLLTKNLNSARKRGWLTRDDLIAIGYWKSPRAIKHIKSNHYATIKKVTQNAFKTKSESSKIKELTTLSGVSLPMASAILTLTNPKRYGVIDIRVWEILYKMGVVDCNPKGTNFRTNH